MNVLVMSDVAGRLDRLTAVLEQARAAHVDAVFVLGNIVSATVRREAHGASRREGRLSDALKADLAREAAADHETYARAVAVLGALGVPVYLIPGEQDAPLSALKDALVNYRGTAPLHFVHRGAAPLGGTDVVAGFGGALTTDAGEEQLLLRFRDWEARMLFEHLPAFNPTFQLAQRRIFLFGAPPRGGRVDLLDGEHVGASVLNQINRQYQPHLVCCAGPASGRGVELVDGALVVNPGSLAAGSYAIVDLGRLPVTGRLFRLMESIPSESTLFRSIIVALDGSPESWRALELATGLARSSGSRLTLLHAWEPVRGALGEPYSTLAVEERIEHGERLLERAENYVADLLPTRDLVEGPAADAILRVADAQHADLIAIGARDHGVLRALLGSVSSRVLQHAPCPVLIARQGPSNPALVEQNAMEAEQLP